MQPPPVSSAPSAMDSLQVREDESPSPTTTFTQSDYDDAEHAALSFRLSPKIKSDTLPVQKDSRSSPPTTELLPSAHESPARLHGVDPAKVHEGKIPAHPPKAISGQSDSRPLGNSPTQTMLHLSLSAKKNRPLVKRLFSCLCSSRESVDSVESPAEKRPWASYT